LSEQQQAPLPKWVRWSTRESIDNDVPSVMAIVETILAVPAYWAISLYYETYWPLLLSLLVAPLVLLRSDESVALGVRWFLARYEKVFGHSGEYSQLSGSERVRVWLVGLFSVAAAFGFGYIASQQFLIGVSGWDAF
jgi:hypothetical protein